MGISIKSSDSEGDDDGHYSSNESFGTSEFRRVAADISVFGNKTYVDFESSAAGGGGSDGRRGGNSKGSGGGGGWEARRGGGNSKSCGRGGCLGRQGPHFGRRGPSPRF